MVKHRLIGVRQTAVAAMLLLSAPVMAQDVTAEDPMNAMIARFLSQRRETVGDAVIKVSSDEYATGGESQPSTPNRIYKDKPPCRRRPYPERWF